MLIWSSCWPASAILSSERPTPREAHGRQPKMAILHRLKRRFGTALVLQGQVEGRISPLALARPKPVAKILRRLALSAAKTDL